MSGHIKVINRHSTSTLVYTDLDTPNPDTGKPYTEHRADVTSKVTYTDIASHATALWNVVQTGGWVHSGNGTVSATVEAVAPELTAEDHSCIP